MIKLNFLKVYFLFLAAIFYFFILEAVADTIYLKNGRNIEGLIKSEDENSVKLDVGIGTIGFKRSEIEKIIRSDNSEQNFLKEKWDKQRLESEKRDKEIEEKVSSDKTRKWEPPRAIGKIEESGHIFVDAILNKKAKAHLLVDTGASVMLLPNSIGKKLGYAEKGVKNMIQLQVADGRKVNARYVSLDNVSVEGVEVNDVACAILMDDVKDAGFDDGLLGMSFLNKFNFKIDQEKKKLILERLK